MPADPDRRQIHAYVSDEGHEAWRNAATAAGVNVSALIEAVGLEMAAAGDKTPKWLRSAEQRARAVQAERLRRPR